MKNKLINWLKLVLKIQFSLNSLIVFSTYHDDIFRNNIHCHCYNTQFELIKQTSAFKHCRRCETMFDCQLAAVGCRGKSFSGCRGANKYVRLSDPMKLSQSTTSLCLVFRSSLYLHFMLRSQNLWEPYSRKNPGTGNREWYPGRGKQQPGFTWVVKLCNDIVFYY